MPATKTDNHYLADKIELRLRHSPWPADRPLKVLDAYGGKGLVWRGVERLAGKPVARTAIDSRLDLMDFHLHGDNLKVMQSLDFSEFDVIDLDAYGIPADQINLVADRGYTGAVFVTAIQTMHGRIPRAISDAIGIPRACSAEAASLIARRGFEYLKEWLALLGVEEVVHRSKNRKHYLYMRFSGAAALAADSGNRPGERAASPF